MEIVITILWLTVGYLIGLVICKILDDDWDGMA
jgi:hypothetical protein